MSHAFSSVYTGLCLGSRAQNAISGTPASTELDKYKHRKHQLCCNQEPPLKDTICRVGQRIRHPVANSGPCANQHILNSTESLSLPRRKRLSLPYWYHGRVQSGSHPSHDAPDDKLSWTICGCLDDRADRDQGCAD